MGVAIYDSKRKYPANQFGVVSQLIDGTIVGNEFIDKSGNGYNLDIINNDIESGFGFPYKCAAMVAQKAANFGKIPNPNYFWFTAGGTPNQIPVVSLFQNIDYGNQIFTKHQAQGLNTNSEEVIEPMVTMIVTYKTPLVSSVTEASTYFGVPAEDLTAKWVDTVNGDDTTGDGSKVLPWKTLNKANVSATSGLKIYVKTGAYTENINPGATYYYIQTNHVWQSAGFVTWKNVSGTRVALLVGTQTKTFNNIIFDGTNSTSANIEVFSGSTNNTFNKCKFVNTATYQYVQSTGAISFNSCVFDIGSKASIFRLDATISVVGCYYKGTLSFSVDDTTSTSYSNHSYCKFNLSHAGVALLKPSVSGATYNWSYNTFYLQGANPILCVSSGSLFTSVTFNYNTVISSTITSNIMFRSLGASATISIQHNYVYLSNATFANYVFDVREAATININYNSIKTEATNNTPHISVTNGSGGTTTTCNINYNMLQSKSLSGHIVIVGAEVTGATTNKINGGSMIGNAVYSARYYDTASTGATHGLFIGFQKDWIVKYNYVNGAGINIIVKGTSTTSWTTGVISYNVSINGKTNNFYSKGVDGVKYYNNTSYNNLNTGTSFYHFEFSINTGGDGAANNQIKNCLIIDQSVNATSRCVIIQDALSASGFVSNYNIIYSLSGSIGTYVSDYNFVGWQGLGYDANSTNPTLAQANNMFADSINYKPTETAISHTGGEDLGATYQDGLHINSDFYNGYIRYYPYIETYLQLTDWHRGAWLDDTVTPI